MYLGRLGSVPWEAWKCTLGGLEVYLGRLGSVPWDASSRLGNVPCEAWSNPRKQGLGFRK